MKNQSLGLTILYWVETVVAARVLLFTVPVLISKSISQNLSPSNVSDWFVLMATLAALVYLLTGIASLLGHKLSKIYHFIAMIIVLGMTLGLYSMIYKTHASQHIIYMFPIVFSILVVAFLLTVKPLPTTK